MVIIVFYVLYNILTRYNLLKYNINFMTKIYILIKLYHIIIYITYGFNL